MMRQGHSSLKAAISASACAWSRQREAGQHLCMSVQQAPSYQLMHAHPSHWTSSTRCQCQGNNHRALMHARWPAMPHAPGRGGKHMKR